MATLETLKAWFYRRSHKSNYESIELSFRGLFTTCCTSTSMPAIKISCGRVSMLWNIFTLADCDSCTLRRCTMRTCVLFKHKKESPCTFRYVISEISTGHFSRFCHSFYLHYLVFCLSWLFKISFDAETYEQVATSPWISCRFRIAVITRFDFQF